ncbi:MAG: NAD-dependent epimerase/dehydratase family protein, partial [Caulobacter sp.]|nr:NAD-dependent epimerase/dehydratase family protein [Caulobacter sp.]
GFIGANLADRLASDGHDVIVFDALARPGVDRNLAWLKDRHPRRITAEIGDIRDQKAVDRVARDAVAVFHLAAQVAVTTSLIDPVADFEVNVRGAVNLLEALRRRGRRTPLVFASTNKVYGDLADVPLEIVDDCHLPRDPSIRLNGVDERRPLDFHTPYGCSKGAADQYVLDYARSFDLPTSVLRMSCIYGPRQMGTEDQGWVAHFLIRALAGQPITIYGDGRQVRDILYVADAVEAYVSAWRRIEGISANAVSLRLLLGHIEALLGREVRLRFEDWRPGDQRYYVSDASAVRRALQLGEPTAWRDGVARLLTWLREEVSTPPAAQPVAEAVS